LRRGDRQWEVLTTSERRILSRGPLVDYLLEKGFAARFQDPQKMADLAKTACAVAGGLSTKRYGRAVVADMRARAWAELANAYRVLEDFEQAAGAFARARTLMLRGTGSALLVARVSELMASYLGDLRRFSEAISLLEEAQDLYGQCHEQAGVERSLLGLAHMLTEANEPERAVIAYLRALRRMSPESANLLAPIHGLALNLVESGHCDLAQSLLRRHQRLYRRGGRLNQFRRFWLEGKIAIGLHEYGKAEGKLSTARLAFIRADKPYEAALVALDLSWVLAKEGRRREVIWQVDDMLRTFTALGIARESFASLILLKKSCEQQRPVEALCGQIESLVKLLPELAPRRGKKASGA
jgi:tetratricopeptide (TPR) repeat protein